jgi:histidyl-tRNA synthetase
MYAVDSVQKFYTIGPMFRRERPQKGRYRQFYQINAEVFGVASALIDVQLIFILMTLLKRLDVSDVQAHINSLGCPECRPNYRLALAEFLLKLDDRLCADCRRRRERNPLRVLDCKVPSCREALTDAPSILDHLCNDCHQDFETVKTALDRLGIVFLTDKRLVRGLDYYTRTTFEIQTGALGAQSAVAGGGRYDGLVKMLDGPDTPATGFAIGLDRLAEIVGQKKAAAATPPILFAAALGDEGQQQAFQWVSRWCEQGLRTEMDLGGRSLKSQMKRADKLGAAYVMIIGDNELSEGVVILRNMKTKEQVRIAVEEVVEKVGEIVHG